MAPKKSKTKNQYGLRRKIPSKIKREIRNRSKFGCVICRCGFYQYEHIDPTYAKASRHDPSKICCLCASCHDRVTRGQLSKQSVQKSYDEIQTQKNAPFPWGPLDFHDGHAELTIGGMVFDPPVQTILKYMGRDIIKVHPGRMKNQHGSISAVFCDDNGRETLRMHRNTWTGSTQNWDIEVVASRISVRKKRGRILLRLRLEPPGKIVIERLDMRIGDAHVLASESSHAVGRYLTDGKAEWIHWVSLNAYFPESISATVAIEIGNPQTILSKLPKEVTFNSTYIGDGGFTFIPLGVSLASNSMGKVEISSFEVGRQDIEKVRKAVNKDRPFGEPLNIPNL